MHNRIYIIAAVLSLLSLQVTAQNPLLDSIQSVSSKERIMEDVSYFTDLYGPRFFGTPNYYNALLHAEEALKSEGIDVHLEQIDGDFRGWGFSSFNIEMSSPQYSPISAYPLAFSKSTNGQQEGELVFIDKLQDAYDLKGSLTGKIIMYRGLYRQAGSVKQKMYNTLSDETLTKAAANPDPNDVIIGYHSRTSVPGVFEWRQQTKERFESFYRFLAAEGVIAAIEPSDYPYGILHADGNRTMPSFKMKTDYNPIASFVISNEHFGRLLRLHDMGQNPKLNVQLTAQYYTNSDFNKNLIAELPGSDPILKDELVIIGAHFDSWHAGTGATDNAANAALLIEVIRVLKQVQAENKRTIRLILWAGHEQVYVGSSQYLNKYVADMKTGEPREEHKKISAYLNLDNGQGKIRGVYLSGNKEVEPYFAKYLQPFPDSNTLTIQNANQTEHGLFDYLNIPAFQFIQDPLDYIEIQHHTNLDVYEYIPPIYQEFNADLIAYLAIQIANEKELLPRKPYNFVQPSREGNVTFTLKGFEDAKNVSVIGDFNSWDMFNLPMYKTEEGWEMKLNLPKGRYVYKFIVDGWWTNNPAVPEHQLVKDGKGHGGLTVLYVE
ncbi:MAG: M28 family peptidase [Bacteroidota bacterium]